MIHPRWGLPVFRRNIVNSSEQPFQKWLGIDSPRPTWFELLGIPVTESDPVKIKVAAKAAMNMLREPPGDADWENWKMVRRQIKRAYHGLIDESTRLAYLQQLAATDAEDAASGESFDNKSIPTAIPLAEVVTEPPAVGWRPGQPDAQVVGAARRPGRMIGRRHRPSLAILTVAFLITGAVAAIWFVSDVTGRPPAESFAAATSGPTVDEKISPAVNRQNPRGGRGEDSDKPPADRATRSATDRLARDSGSKLPGETPSAERSGPVPADSAGAQPVFSGPANDLAAAHHLDQAWVNLLRHNFDRTEEHLEAVQEYQLDGETAGIRDRLLTVNRDYREFQSAVRRIARGMDAVDELDVGEHRILITSTSGDAFVFWFGQRIALPWRQLPGLLALAIYQRQFDESSPQYLMAQCLLYGIAARRNPAHQNMAAELLSRADRLGLPVSDYRKFASDKIRGPGQAIAAPERPAVNRQKRELAARYPLRNLDPGGSQALAVQLRDEALTTVDPVHRMALVEWAIESAEISQQPLLVDELLALQDRLTGASSGDGTTRLASFDRVSRGKLSADRADELVDCYLELAACCRSPHDQGSRETCIERARRICRQFELESRLQAIDRRFGSVPTGQFGIE